MIVTPVGVRPAIGVRNVIVRGLAEPLWVERAGERRDVGDRELPGQWGQLVGVGGGAVWVRGAKHWSLARTLPAKPEHHPVGFGVRQTESH